MGKLHSSRQMSTCPILRRPTMDVRASSASPTHHHRSLSTHGRRARRGEAGRRREANRRVVLSSQPKESISLLLFFSFSLSLSSISLLFHFCHFPFLHCISRSCASSRGFFFWFAHTLQWSRWSLSFKGLWFLQFPEIESVLSMSLFYSLVGRVPDLLSLSDYYCYGFIEEEEEEGFCKIEGLSYYIYDFQLHSAARLWIECLWLALSGWGGGLDICHRNIWAEVHMLLFSIGTNVFGVLLLF